MKSTILLFLLLIAFPVLCQEPNIEFSDEFPDFTKINANANANKQANSPTKINKIDTIIELFGENNWDTDFEIVSNNHIISKRRYFPDTKIINKEFIRINKFKYHYLENDSLNHNRLIAEGDFIVSAHAFMSVDTIQTIDPNTYETIGQIVKRPKLLKDGEWFESDSVFLYRGNYKNDKREGKWTKHKREEGIEEAELNYKNGTLISNEINLLAKNDTNAIKTILIGKWCVEIKNHQSDIFNLTKSNCSSNFHYKFNENATFEFIVGKSLNNQDKNFDTWKINDQFELEQKDFKTGKVIRFKFLLVRINVMQLRRI